MKYIQKRLSAQMLLALLLLAIVPLSLLGFIAFNSGRQIIIENVQTHLKTVGILKRQAIENWVEQLQYSLKYLSQDHTLLHDVEIFHSAEGTLRVKNSAYSALVKRFQQLVELGQVSHVSLINADSGQIIVSSTPSWVGTFRDSSVYFVEGKKSYYVSDIFLSLSMGRPTMVISGPLVDKQGRLQAVLAVHANFDHLSGIMLERSGLSETTETFLVNKANLLLTNTVFAPDGAFKKWIYGEGAIRAIAGESDVDLFNDYRGKEVIGAYFWLPERKLALIVKQDVVEAFAPIGDLRQKTFFIGLTIIFLVLLAGVFFGKRIVASLQNLVAGTEAVGRGDLDYRINSQAQDEIGTLSKAFDQMAKNLQIITISLDEKEVLLREIHHRVKNNLQMVQSLLSLQINQQTDDAIVAPLKDSMHRITSIAMVHETLYKSDDLSIIDLDSYFRDLVKYLMKSLRASDTHIDIVCNIEPLSMELDCVIACGLIINELVTNAMKYAFVQTKVGEISIGLYLAEENCAELVVADNGVGILSFEETSAKKSLGLDLVNILAKNQLDGSIETVHDAGLKYIIKFPL